MAGGVNWNVFDIEGFDGVLGVVVGLLRHLRSHRIEYDAELRELPEADQQSLKEWRHMLERHFPTIPRDPRFIDAATLIELLETTSAPSAPRLQIQRQIAVALDNTYGYAFYGLCVDAYSREGREGYHNRFSSRVLPGDPIPVSYERREAVRGRRRATRDALPHNQAPDRLHHLTLVPTLEGDTEVWIDLRLDESWPQPLTARVATCHPTTRAQDFSGDPFPIAPRHIERTTATAIAQLDVASQNRASLVIFPELVSTPAVRVALIEHWRSQAKPCPVLVPGSEHVLDGHERCNIAMVLTAADAADACITDDVPWYAHKKFAATTGVRDGQAFLREPLGRQPIRVRIHLTPALKLGLMICRDFLVDEALELVKKLEIDILVVPAMTPVIDPFQGSSDDLARRYLTEVYLANTWRARDPGAPTSAGLAALPQLDQVVRVIGVAEREPGVGLITTDPEISLTWLPTPVETCS